MPIEAIIAIIIILVIGTMLSTLEIRIKKKTHSNPKQELMTSAVSEHSGSANTAIAISEIERLILTNGDGQELSLERPDVVQNAEKKYKEITIRGSSIVGQMVQGTILYE